MNTTLINRIAVGIVLMGLPFLGAGCSDKSGTDDAPPGAHVHEDGTAHSDHDQAAQPPGTHVHEDGAVHEDHASDTQTDAQDRSYHVHGDGSIHYSEGSESRVSGNIIYMPGEEIAQYGIGVGAARPGRLEIKSTFPGQIAINADKMAHIVPRVAGIVREVKANLGDKVQTGDVMAVIDSRELADAKADYLASMERLELAQANFERQERLWKKEITSEKEYLNSRQSLAEAKINIRATKQKLISMGFTSAYLDTLPAEPDELFTRYEVVAPISGTVIEKKVAFGEVLKDDAEVFIVADLSTVWINLQVFKKDLPLIRERQPVRLTEQSYLPDTHGVIDYVGPIVGAETQTATVRVVQPNPSGELRPGLFVNAHVTVKSTSTDVLVHKDHIQNLADTPCVFVQVPGGFELRLVTVGDSDGEYVAITKGLAAGEKYATKNSFLLKAELDRSSGGLHVHADGTVH